MNTGTTYYQEIINKLERTDRRSYLRLILQGLIRTGFAMLSLFFVFSLAEMIFHFSFLVRTILFFVLMIVFVSMAVHFIIIPILKYFGVFNKRDYVETAGMIGNHFPEIKDDLKNAMQLVDSTGSNYYSKSLIEAAFNSIYNKARSIKFESVINFKALKKQASQMLSAFVVLTLFFLFLPGLSSAASRLLQYSGEFVSPPKFLIEVIPGNTEVTKGTSFDIITKITGDHPTQISLFIRSDEQTDYVDYVLEKDSMNNFVYQVSQVRSSFNYFIQAEDISSDIFRTEVIDNPLIKTISFRVTPPSYSQIPSFEQKDNGNITALLGSKVDVILSSTKALSSATLEFEDSTTKKLNIKDTYAEGSFRIANKVKYRILIKDEKGNDNQNPITYIIKPVYDELPVIEMISPAKDISLPNDNRIPLYFRIADDFGFTKLLLHYKLSGSRYETIAKEFTSLELSFPSSQSEAEIDYIWNLTQLSPAVDDLFSYYLEIFDNDNTSGPKSAKTPVYFVRVPSLEEILAGVDRIQNEAVDDLKETLEEAEKLKKDLEKLDQDLKQDKRELTWEEKEKIEKTLDRFEQLQDKMSDIQDNIQKVQQELQQNDLLSQETLEKYMELQELMSELTSDEFKKAMEKFRNLLEQMNRNMAQNELQNLKLDEERFKKSIERTLNLLKRMQIEQKFDEMLKRTEQIIEQQEILSDQTKQNEQNNVQNQEQLSNKQDELTGQIEDLAENMQDLGEKMRDLDDMPNEDMEKLIEEMKKQMNEKLSEQASKNLKQNQMQKAMQNQQQLNDNMQQMMDMLQDMKDQLMQQNQMKVFTDMMRILDNILKLSQKQEELKKQSEVLDPNSSQFSDNAKQQNNLKQNLNRLLQQLSELSQKTFAVSPEMGKALGNANQQMDASIQAMQNRNGSFAAVTQGEAMKHLNEAAAMMKNSMESMMQSGGSGGGMMSLMQQLQQMSGQQMNLNNMTQMLQQMMQGNMSPGQQAELQRLGQQQEAIRKSLEQLNEEARLSGESKKIPADLEDIVRQMQEVVTDMETDRLDDQLIQKQERILSKLLDAQRSMNERDFEKQRRSETGKQVVRNSPSELNLLPNQAKQKIKDELNRAVREGFKRDYEELIRRYYEALQKELNN